MKLTVKQKYQLHKEYKGVPRVVVYTGDTEESWKAIDPNDLFIGNIAEGVYSLGDFLKMVKKEFKEVRQDLTRVKNENKELHATIKNLLQVKGE